MKIKLLFVVFVALTFLTGCSKKTEYEIFTELYNKAVDKLNDSDSYTLAENSFYNFELNSKSLRTSLATTSDVISEPYYNKVSITQDITNVGKVDTKVLVIEDGENYKMYTKLNSYVHVDTLTKKEFEENENKELDITLNRIPDTVEKIEEKTVNDEKIVTYETTFTLNDLDSEDQVLFDTLIEFYIGPSITHTMLMDVEIKETIVLNSTTKQLVEISYDTTAFFTEAFNNLINSEKLGWEISNTSSEYSFEFSNLNNVNKDTSFIDEMTN